MATLSKADVGVAMSLILDGQMTDQFRRDMILGNIIKVEEGYNENLTYKAKMSGRTAGGAYAEGADMADADFDSHTRRQVVLPWAQYRTGAKVSGLAMATSAARGVYTPQDGAGSLFTEEVRDGIDKLAVDIGSDVYGGNETATPAELAGALRVIGDSLGAPAAFGGLTSATDAEWAGNYGTTVLANFTKANIGTANDPFATIRSQLFRPIKDATGRDPDFCTCPGAIFDAIRNLYNDPEQVMTETITVPGRPTINLKQVSGARAIIFDGVPIIEDRHATAGNLFGFTAADMCFKQVPAVQPDGFSIGNVREAIRMLTGVDVEVDEIERKLRMGGSLRPTIELLAQNGDAYRAQIKIYLQLKWRSRNGHGRLEFT